MTDLCDPTDDVLITLQMAHENVSANHPHSRRAMLDALPELPSRGKRFNLAIVYSVSSLAAIFAFVGFFFFASPQRPASALERIAKALDQVTSYSYRHEFISVSHQEGGRTVRQVSIGQWRSNPVGLHATTQIHETLNTNSPEPDPAKLIVDLLETHRADGPGIIVDCMKKEYSWIHEKLDSDSIGNPLRAIYMVRQRRGRITADLGTKKINSQNANGFEIVLGQSAESDLGKASSGTDWDWKNTTIEVWVDSVTNLPIEFQFVRKGDDFQSTNRFSNLEWNPTFPADAFRPVVPGEDYTEIVPK